MVGRLGLRTEVFLNRDEPSTKQFFSIGAAAVESCRLKIRFATGKGLSVSAALALLALAGAATLSVLLHVSLFLKN